MNGLNLAGDLLSLVASLVSLSFVIGVWRMVRAKSRLVLITAVAYMVITRVVIIIAIAQNEQGWIAAHRSLIIVPQYVLFAVAFGMTYFEIRNFRFEVPRGNPKRGSK